ncbi:MAG TPA: PDZ domain-containing protein [Tepidisphaeraceae bacterium]|jgi:hypothetical protein|nr:PDZ domain-containing protein [Tepidisphaeraceae bacterium]
MTRNRRITADADPKQNEFERAMEADLVLQRNAFTPYKQKTEKASYIGIATSPIPTVLRDQLKLEKGSGLVVDRVDPESPAEAAGIKPSDVIQKLDDQVLINPHQFGVLVRTLKPDVEVKLSIIREAKPQTINVKPVEKELAVLDEAGAYGPAGVWRDAQGLAGAADAIKRFGGGGGQYTITKPNKAGGGDFFTFTDRAEVVTDNGQMVTTTTVGPNGERRVRAIDKATGKIIFDGAIDTEEQKLALPKEVADQVKTTDEMKVARGPIRIATPRAFVGKGNALNVRVGNNLPKPKTVSGSDDDFTWEFTTKTDENGKAELDLLLLDKNGKILFQGPFSRSRDIPTLPQPVGERLSSSPWDIMIEDLKGGGGGGNFGGVGGALNMRLAPAPVVAPGAPAAPAK